MRPLLIAALLSGLAFSSVHAATTLVVDVNGNKNSYTLNSLTVDSSGNVTVSATSGGTTTPAQPDTTQPDTTQPDTTQPDTTQPDTTQPNPSTGCVNSGTLTCVSTSLPTQTFQRQTYKPSPSMVFAYKLKTPDSAGPLYARAIATRMSGTTQSKLLVVSEIPGDVSIEGKPRGCYRQSTEATTLQLVMNRPDLSTLSTCHLKPNTVYYINAASKYYSGVTSCSAASNCGFYFEGS